MINGLFDGAIRIGEETYTQTVAITPTTIIEKWCDKGVPNLTLNDFGEILRTNPEVIVLGTGTNIIFAPRDLVFALARDQIGFEVMNTAAAARTFNVLASENRRVAAVLYL